MKQNAQSSQLATFGPPDSFYETGYHVTDEQPTDLELRCGIAAPTAYAGRWFRRNNDRGLMFLSWHTEANPDLQADDSQDYAAAMANGRALDDAALIAQTLAGRFVIDRKFVIARDAGSWEHEDISVVGEGKYETGVTLHNDTLKVEGGALDTTDVKFKPIGDRVEYRDFFLDMNWEGQAPDAVRSYFPGDPPYHTADACSCHGIHFPGTVGRLDINNVRILRTIRSGIAGHGAVINGAGNEVEDCLSDNGVYLSGGPQPGSDFACDVSGYCGGNYADGHQRGIIRVNKANPGITILGANYDFPGVSAVSHRATYICTQEFSVEGNLLHTLTQGIVKIRGIGSLQRVVVNCEGSDPVDLLVYGAAGNQQDPAPPAEDNLIQVSAYNVPLGSNMFGNDSHHNLNHFWVVMHMADETLQKLHATS